MAQIINPINNYIKNVWDYQDYIEFCNSLPELVKKEYKIAGIIKDKNRIILYFMHNKELEKDFILNLKDINSNNLKEENEIKYKKLKNLEASIDEATLHRLSQITMQCLEKIIVEENMTEEVKEDLEKIISQLPKHQKYIERCCLGVYKGLEEEEI